MEFHTLAEPFELVELARSCELPITTWHPLKRSLGDDDLLWQRPGCPIQFGDYSHSFAKNFSSVGGFDENNLPVVQAKMETRESSDQHRIFRKQTFYRNHKRHYIIYVRENR